MYIYLLNIINLQNNTALQIQFASFKNKKAFKFSLKLKGKSL